MNNIIRLLDYVKKYSSLAANYDLFLLRILFIELNITATLPSIFKIF